MSTSSAPARAAHNVCPNPATAPVTAATTVTGDPTGGAGGSVGGGGVVVSLMHPTLSPATDNPARLSRP
jgi:hypothetical protein